MWKISSPAWIIRNFVRLSSCLACSRAILSFLALLLVSRHIQFGFLIRFLLSRSNMCDNSNSSLAHTHTYPTHTSQIPIQTHHSDAHSGAIHDESERNRTLLKLEQIYKLNILLFIRITVRHIVHAFWKSEKNGPRSFDGAKCAVAANTRLHCDSAKMCATEGIVDDNILLRIIYYYQRLNFVVVFEF